MTEKEYFKHSLNLSNAANPSIAEEKQFRMFIHLHSLTYKKLFRMCNASVDDIGHQMKECFLRKVFHATSLVLVVLETMCGQMLQLFWHFKNNGERNSDNVFWLPENRCITKGARFTSQLKFYNFAIAIGSSKDKRVTKLPVPFTIGSAIQIWKTFIRSDSLLIAQNEITTLIKLLTKWLISINKQIKIKEIAFPIVGHSFVTPR